MVSFHNDQVGMVEQSVLVLCIGQGCVSCWDFFTLFHDGLLPREWMLPEDHSPLLIHLFEFHSILEMCFNNLGKLTMKVHHHRCSSLFYCLDPHSNLLSLPCTYSLLTHFSFLCFCVLFCFVIWKEKLLANHCIVSKDLMDFFTARNFFKSLEEFLGFFFFVFPDDSDYILPLS